MSYEKPVITVYDEATIVEIEAQAASCCRTGTINA